MKKVLVFLILFMILAGFAMVVFAAEEDSSIECHSLYWFDDVNKSCGQRQFCGLYMYQSLQTFENQTACIDALATSTEDPLPVNNTNATCKDVSDMCSIEDTACCAGLVKIGLCHSDDNSSEEDCVCANCGTICSPCGNGVCDENENKCNCPEDCQKNYSKKTDKKEAVQEKNRLKFEDKTGQECPDNCTCTGSTVKCNIDGGRTMTVYAGKSGNVIVQIKGENITTNVTLYKADGKIYGKFKNNETKEINVTEEQIREKVEEQLNAMLQNNSVELDENGYKVLGWKKARLLLLLPVEKPVTVTIDPETGEITKIKTPWWNFLTKDE